MHDPQPQPPSYENVLKAIRQVPSRFDNSIPEQAAKGNQSTSTNDWMQRARSEFNTLSQDNLEFRETHFAWKSAAVQVASPWGTSSCISAVWRGVAKRTFETVALLAKPKLDASQQQVIHMHAR